MPLRLVSFVIAMAVTIWLGYLLWPQGATPPAPTPAPTPERALTAPNTVHPSPPPAANRKSQAASTFIEGITTDISGRPLEGTDVLHRVLTITVDQQCHELSDTELELNSNTELLTSDAQGRFRLPFQPLTSADNYRYCLIASAHKQGYLATTVSMPLDMEELPDLVDIELSPNLPIVGQVVDPANRPVDGAKVLAWQAQESAEEEACGSEEPVASSNTNPSGEFTIHVADEANYCLQALHPRWSRSQAQRVTGADLADLRLQLGHRARVSGTTVDLQGAPLANLTLALSAQQSHGAEDRTVTRTDHEGNFVFDQLDYAVYRLSSENSEYQVAEPQEVEVSEASAQQELTVKVFPVTTVSGQVFDAYGQPLAQATVTAYSPFSKSDTVAEAVSNGQGEFSLPSLHRSEIAVESFRMATAMLEGVSRPFSGELCLDVFHPQHGSQTLSFAATRSTLNVGSIHLQRPTLEIAGRVLNHRDESVMATLVLEPASPQGPQAPEPHIPGCEDVTLSRQISTDSDGQFSFNLPKAGAYRVEIRTDRYQARTFQVDFAASDRNVEIRLD